MRLAILQEAFPNNPERFREMVDEAVFADEMGFHGYGVSEIHFLGKAGVSAPEVLLGAIATRTKRIKVRFLSAVLLTFNHPVRVAERIATLDVLTGGRAEAATARSQQPQTLVGFGIDPSETRAQWAESVDLIVKAFTDDPFEHHGTYWDIPPRTLHPRPIQQPHPPLYASATSLETHQIAGEKGMGVISGNSLPGGWSYVEESLGTYRRALEEAVPVSPDMERMVAVASLVVHCAESAEQAKEEARPRIHSFLDVTIARRRQLAPTSPDYAYQVDGFDEIEARRDDFDHLIERAPYFSVGEPEFFVERCRRLEALAVDELILTIEGLGHELHMQTIELLGKHVIPVLQG